MNTKRGKKQTRNDDTLESAAVSKSIDENMFDPWERQFSWVKPKYELDKSSIPEIAKVHQDPKYKNRINKFK